MFSFFGGKKISKQEIVDRLAVDLHSHLIPGIDDGAQTLDESIELIQNLSTIGYKKLIITPHIMIDVYKNEEDNIIERLEILKKAINKVGIDIDLEVAAEYYLDEGFLEHLNNKPLLIADEYLLFETSYMAKPMNLYDIVFEISSKGYKPILAHPERYRYIHHLKREYSKLKDMGVFFQLDINSIGGFYGKDAQKKANFLIESRMVDFVGSDTHNMRHIGNLNTTLSKMGSVWNKLFEHNTILNNTL